MLKTGIFTLSIDFEFAWGLIDQCLTDEKKDLTAKELTISETLLSLFDAYNIPVTWAIVGHLLDDNWNYGDFFAHKEYNRPIYKNEKTDWFINAPKKSEKNNLIWFDKEKFIQKIVNSTVNHEIASHSYAHLNYSDEITKKNVEVDVDNAKRIHQKYKLEFETFVFPYNLEGYHNVLKNAGIEIFRGKSRRYYSSLPDKVQRIFNILDYFLPIDRTVLPEIHNSGLINIPDSMLLLGRNGLRKFLPRTLLLNKGIKGINMAAKKRRIFHLWFHPSNFSYETDKQFEIIDLMLRKVVALRENNQIEVLPLKKIKEKICHKPGIKF